MKVRLTKRVIDAAKYHGSGGCYLWDAELANFGLRLYPSGRKSFVVNYRVRGKQRPPGRADLEPAHLAPVRKAQGRRHRPDRRGVAAFRPRDRPGFGGAGRRTCRAHPVKSP